MTSVFKIHDTVLEVSKEAQILMPQMPVIKDESELLSELVLCILSSQEKYEVALAVMKSLQNEKVLRIPENQFDFIKIKSQLKNILESAVFFQYKEKKYSRRLRFFVKKEKYVSDTIENIYLSNLTINKILNSQDCIHKTRDSIIYYSCGLGPKQASMFLRNIGYYAEFAVLDKHVINYMRLMGLTNISENSFSNMSSYKKIETKLKLYADTYNLKLLHLDLAIWTTMRTLKTTTHE